MRAYGFDAVMVHAIIPITVTVASELTHVLTLYMMIENGEPIFVRKPSLLLVLAALTFYTSTAEVY